MKKRIDDFLSTTSWGRLKIAHTYKTSQGKPNTILARKQTNKTVVWVG